VVKILGQVADRRGDFPVDWMNGLVAMDSGNRPCCKTECFSSVKY
jgi:hypothetical protein